MWFKQFDNSIENLGHRNSNYAYGLGFGSASAGPLDLFKLTFGEGGIRAPMLIDGPGIKGGQRVNALTYVWDIMPTILAFAEITHPKDYRGRPVERMRGRSLKGPLTGTKKTAYDPKEYICGGEMGGHGGWVRQGSFKAVVNGPPYGSGKLQLFNVVEDPGETRDLAKVHPEMLTNAREAWQRYAKEVGVVLPKRK